MSQTFDSLCFFLISGHTFTFRQAEVLSDNETAITIRYTAMSDGLRKVATFYKSALAGVARRENERDEGARMHL